jgi:hypothetical protein
VPHEAVDSILTIYKRNLHHPDKRSRKNYMNFHNAVRSESLYALTKGVGSDVHERLIQA